MITGWYYLHTNGNLIYKKDMPGIIEDFIKSDFVKRYWSVDLEKRENAWTILVEALAAGADRNRIDELANKWNCDDNDAQIFAAIRCVMLTKKELKWNASKDRVTCTGNTCLGAMARLAKMFGGKT